MTYTFRISLPNIKGFARIYEVNAANSLYTFHKQMLFDMDFPQDQIVLFKAFDAAGKVVARYATINIGDGSIESISIKQAVEKGIVRFEYFYDTTNKKSVIVTLEEENPKSNTAKPVLLSSKGPNPEEFLNGYVAFEDLPPEKQKHPDDDGFIDDDDEEDDEPEESTDPEEYDNEEEDLPDGFEKDGSF